jgi:hypothetical protein
VADALELGRLKDGTSDTDPESLRKLYRHCRNDDGKRVMFEQDSTFVGKWINLDLPAAKEIIAVFVPLDDESDLKKARKIARMNLEAVPWNDILRIPSPGIRLRIKIHGRRWGMRFESGEPALRGRQTINEQLPPIPSDAPADRIPDGVPTADTPSPAPTDIPVTHSEATDVLRSAGMPS